jgi:hypothetical protein
MSHPFGAFLSRFCIDYAIHRIKLATVNPRGNQEMPDLPFDSYVAAILANGIIQRREHTAEDAVKTYADVLLVLQNSKSQPNS